MGNRSILHRTKLNDFKEWLKSRGIAIHPCKGQYEVLRWEGKQGQPMPMVFDRHDGDHYTVNVAAEPLVRKWLTEKWNDPDIAHDRGLWFKSELTGQLYRNYLMAAPVESICIDGTWYEKHS